MVNLADGITAGTPTQYAERRSGGFLSFKETGSQFLEFIPPKAQALAAGRPQAPMPLCTTGSWCCPRHGWRRTIAERPAGVCGDELAPDRRPRPS